MDLCRNGTKYSENQIQNSIYNVYASTINQKRKELKKIMDCSLTNYINKQQLDANCPLLSIIEDITFNCSNLKSCDMKCSGPDKKMLLLYIFRYYIIIEKVMSYLVRLNINFIKLSLLDHLF